MDMYLISTINSAVGNNASKQAIVDFLRQRDEKLKANCPFEFEGGSLSEGELNDCADKYLFAIRFSTTKYNVDTRHLEPYDFTN